MKTLNSDLKRYYRSIKKSLLGGYKDKNRLISDLKCRVNDFLSDNPGATIYTVQKHFGTPQAIADEYNSNLTVDIIKNEKLIKKLKYIIFALAAVAFIAIVVLVVYIIVSGEKSKPIFVEDVVIKGDGVNGTENTTSDLQFTDEIVKE